MGNGKWEIVQALPIDGFSRSQIDASRAELIELKAEKSLVAELFGNLTSGMFPVENFHPFWQAGAFDGLEIFHQILPD